MKFIDAKENFQLRAILKRIPQFQTADDRNDFLSICDLEDYCSSIIFDKTLDNFVVHLLAVLTKDYELVEDSELLGLVLLLEHLKIDDYLNVEEINFIELVLNKWRTWHYSKNQNIPQISQLAFEGTITPSDYSYHIPSHDTWIFTGREQDLTCLENWLIKSKGRQRYGVVGISGTPGVGKTALACQFAELHKEDFPDGVICLRVDGLDMNKIAQEFAGFYQEKIKPEDRQRGAAHIMQKVFAQRRILLIFDNAETDKIKALIPPSDKCSVIITARNKGLLFSLGIPFRSQIQLSPLSTEDALNLLEKFAAERVVAEKNSAQEIIKLVGNLPLALTIAGATLHLQNKITLANYAASLREEKTRLDLLKLEHLDVRASFELSLKLLEKETIKFFACLSVCREGGFSVYAARAVANCNKATAQRQLNYLCQLSLLNGADKGDNLYVLHPLIRLFAGEILSADSTLKLKAEAGRAEFYRGLERLTNLNSKNLKVKSIFKKELGDIMEAAKWYHEQEIPKYDFAFCMLPFFEKYGYWQQAVELISGFQLLAERLGEWDIVVRFRIQQAKYLCQLGKLLPAQEILAPIADILDNISPPNTRQLYEAMLLNMLGGVMQRQGRFDEAVDTFKRSAAIGEKLGNQKHLAMVLNSLGGVLEQQRRFDEAVEVLQQSAAIEEQLCNQRGLARVLTSLGGVLQRQERYEEALKILQRSYTIRQQLGDEHGLAMVLHSIGRVMRRLGQFDEAVDAFKRSAVIDEKLGNQPGLAKILNDLGTLLLRRQGQFQEAMDALKRSAAIKEQLGDKIGLAMVHAAMGKALIAHGEPQQATTELEKSFVINESIKNHQGLEIVTPELIKLLKKQGQLEEAQVYCKRALAIAPSNKILLKLCN